MIGGSVTARLEATIQVHILGAHAQSVRSDGMLDTGFNGYVTLPTTLIQSLGLPLVGNRQATLADGSVVALDVYRAEVVWDGEIREVLVLAAEGGVLVGTALLSGSRVTVEFLDGGPVMIEKLP